MLKILKIDRIIVANLNLIYKGREALKEKEKKEVPVNTSFVKLSRRRDSLLKLSLELYL
ncbi:MAG: hypothetical protein PHQ93_05160 [Sulfurimonas sp.]|uniref:hypothetical protein n=1 Tax=Sulfurimonas sp. TaxID=2022749 RepID=UPI00261C370F|nr:hypothetical protein [Sulfurimonas sp.]MDD5400559.1 hypothetical protein [Sulfurimonas sp.]